MAKKCAPQSFNVYIEQIKQKNKIAEARAFAGEGEECDYVHLLVNDGNPREINMLFQRLSGMKRKYNGAIVLDEMYNRRNGETKQAAFIVRGSERSLIDSAISQASEGLRLEYEIKEF